MFSLSEVKFDLRVVQPNVKFTCKHCKYIFLDIHPNRKSLVISRRIIYHLKKHLKIGFDVPIQRSRVSGLYRLTG